MTRRISSGTPWEPVAGYSRAVAAGSPSCITSPSSTDVQPATKTKSPAAQTTQAIANVAAALERLGASLADVVRTRLYVTDIARWREYAQAHGAAFGEIRPASTMVEVAALIDARMLVEVEADAYRPGAGR